MTPRAIAHVLGGDVSGSSVLVPGPGHSAKDRSLCITLDPRAPNGIIVHSFSGDDWRDCRDYVFAKLGIVPDQSAKPAILNQSSERPPSESALSIWAETIPIKGTVADRYLASRSLILPANADDVLRFHSSCPFGKGERYPCMVALYRAIASNRPKAIHRTALTADGRKIDRKALESV
jgi:hypothetical protein